MKRILGFFLFPIDTSKRVYGLDVMRAVAILMVLLFHSRNFITAFSPAADKLYVGGFLGVELFFVLSGFLIGGILIRTVEKEKTISFSSIKKFWIRRWFRTLPNYYLILVINILFSIFILHDFTKDYFSFFFFMQNFGWRHPPVFQEAWSLSVEEWFYLLLPVAMLITYYFSGRKLSGKQIILFAVILFLTVTPIMRIIYVNQFDPRWGNELRRVVLFRLDAIVWGVLAAWINFYYDEIWNKMKRVSLLLSLILFTWIIYFYLKEVRADQPGFFARTFYFSIVNIAGTLLLPYLSNWKISGSLNYFQKVITVTSVISYSLYLVHLSLVMQLIELSLPEATSLNCGLSFVIFWIGSFLLSILLYKYFEKPAMELRERFL